MGRSTVKAVEAGGRPGESAVVGAKTEERRGTQILISQLQQGAGSRMD